MAATRRKRSEDRRRCRVRGADIIFGVMWSVELEPEVEQWIDNRTNKEFASVLPHIERLAEGHTAEEDD